MEATATAKLQFRILYPQRRSQPARATIHCTVKKEAVWCVVLDFCHKCLHLGYYIYNNNMYRRSEVTLAGWLALQSRSLLYIHISTRVHCTSLHIMP